jgi:hypothetical protein
MPRRAPEGVLIIKGQGLRPAERKQVIRAFERDIYNDIRHQFLPQLGEVSIRLLRKEAPKWTGRLHEGIQVVGMSPSRTTPNIRIGVEVRDDKGFPYLAATRFGRRAIEAKGRSTPARTYRTPPGGVQGGGQRRPFRARMLSFEHTQTIDPLYRRRVRAFKPRGDWVRRAEPAIRTAANDAFDFIGDEIQAKIDATNFITGKTTRGRVGHRATVRRL